MQLNGKPTGELDELAAVELAFAAFARADPTFVRYAEGALDRSANLMRRAGITTATDLLFGDGTKEQEEVARALYGTAAALDPAFPRVYLGYSATALIANYGAAGAVAHLQAEARRDTGKIHVGPVKIIFDGSVQGYTAVLSSGYVAPPPPGENPIWNVQPDSIVALAQPFWNAGFRLAVHVNGDSATEELIRAVGKLQAAHRWADHRTTFEHNPAARPGQYDAIRALGGTVNLFAGHIWYYGPQHERYTLGARAADISAADWALSRGIPFSLHSDAPVTPAAPLFSAWNAVNRIMPTTPSDSVLGPQHRITVGQALRAMTMGSAYLLGAEGDIGSLRQGKLGDFVVLGQDPFTVDPTRLCAVPILATVIGGVVWTPPAQKPTTPLCPSVSTGSD